VLTRLLKNVHVFRGSLLEMAALLAHCDLAIMNDSGPMHIAASMGTPTVGIFGDSHTYRWQPRGIATFIQAPSRRFDDIRPEEITEAARQLIGQKAR
jgi:ADP-heptose:LPS heptosyltransferase